MHSTELGISQERQHKAPQRLASSKANGALEPVAMCSLSDLAISSAATIKCHAPDYNFARDMGFASRHRRHGGQVQREQKHFCIFETNPPVSVCRKALMSMPFGPGKCVLYLSALKASSPSGRKTPKSAQGPRPIGNRFSMADICWVENSSESSGNTPVFDFKF